MEKKDIELLENRLGRKIDANFLRECKEAYFESRDSEEFQSLIGLPLELKKAILQRRQKEN